jgi:hypothetical protein
MVRYLVMIAVGILITSACVLVLWWRYSVDEQLGYCETPRETCVNRQGIAVGEPCECHGPGGGVFGLDSTGTVIPVPRSSR